MTGRRRWRRLRWALPALLHACAASSVVSPTSPAPSAAPVGDDLPDLALYASGFEAPAERAEASARLERLLGPILAQGASAASPEARARALLTALHGPDGPLKSYDARATTLRQVLDQGKFNCLSASILYNLAAARLALQVDGELLPTHARSLFTPHPEAPPVIVETTSPLGFAPDPATSRSILSRVLPPLPPGRRGLVATTGARVETRMLIGAMFVNRASLAQEQGQLAAAATLFERAYGLTPDPALRAVLADQRAALATQLAADDITSGDPGLIARGHQSLLLVVSLPVTDPEIHAAVEANLRAAAERLIAKAIEAGDEATARRLLGTTAQHLQIEAEQAGLRAFASGELARLAAERGAYEGALEHVERGLLEPVGEADAPLKEALRQNRWSLLRRLAQNRAQEGDLDRAVALLDRLERPDLPKERALELSEDRRRAHLLAAQQRFQAGDFDGAAGLYRRGLTSYPGDAHLTNNLVVALQRIATPRVNAHQCAEVAAMLDEIERLDPKGHYVKDVRRLCPAAGRDRR